MDIFRLPIHTTVKQFPDQSDCDLFSIDPSYIPTNDDLLRIVSICNQEQIYNRLFREKFKGNPYTEYHAKEFIKQSKISWENKEKFVFLVRKPNNLISSAIDIKSNNINDAEIGYWASIDSPGITTNAVIKVCELAKDNGYLQLNAVVNSNNIKSIGVMKRSNFYPKKNIIKNDTQYIIFRKIL